MLPKILLSEQNKLSPRTKSVPLTNMGCVHAEDVLGYSSLGVCFCGKFSVDCKSCFKRSPTGSRFWNKNII